VVATAAESARPFDALLPNVGAAAPGTYVVNGTTLVPVPDSARIPVLLQADVLRGPERPARVGIVVGADAPQAGDVRLRVSTVPAAGAAAHIVADAGGPATVGPVRLVREFSLPPGDYDLEAVLGDSRPGVGLVAVAKSRLQVPDLRGGSLTVTPIVVGEAAAATGQTNMPFVFGPTTLTPALDGRFSQDRAVSVAFRVYNWTAATGEKPDLTVEYLFYEQGKKGLHFFNKVKPQQINADTLGTAFDPSAGSVAAGMAIPLEAFTFGDFQLLVRVSDNRSKESAEQQVRFTVAP
jgi:hypothetical protein